MQKKNEKKHGGQTPQSKRFWDTEYTTQEHFALSKNPSEDLEKFCRYLERHHGGFPPNWNVLDIGCGNGRHLLHLARAFGARGLGFDISAVAIAQAQHEKSTADASLIFQTGNIEDPLPGTDNEYDLLLDMMASHMLTEEARPHFIAECARVLSPGSWLFLKTFLLDEDMHAARMIRTFPAKKDDGTFEKNSYIHPRLGYLEHAYTEEEITALYSPYFHIEKMIRSHAHIVDGRPNKRRFVSVYMTRRKE